VESIEQVPESKRDAQLAAWKQYAAQVDVGMLYVIQRAENTARAGIKSTELYRECGSY
jgi:NADPH-dependent 7-cyano-7-deazaguanine reductase QueF-like protein